MPATLAPIGVEVGLKYELVGPDGSRAVLNDSTDADWVGFLNGENGVTGLERAGIRESADTLPESDGGVHGAFLSDRLSWTLQGIVPPDGPVGALSWVARQDRLMRASDAMRADGELRWTPSGYGQAVRVRFRAQQPTRLAGRRPKTFLVAGVCEDPAVEAYLENVRTIIPTGGGTGFASPLKSLLTSSPAAPAGAIVTNNGRSPSWPLIRVYGPCSSITVRNATLGLDLVLNYSLNAGEYLELESNPRRRSVRLMGTANRYSALDWSRSFWWPLLAGDNDVRIGMGTFSAGAQVEIRYRDTWG